MRTPGHAVINVALVAHERPAIVAAVVAGAVLPDLPIVALYLLERARGTPVAEIWRDRYRRRVWLDTIHGFHSVPIAAAGAAVACALGCWPAAAFFASALGHDALDVPVHGRDAHRHLFPLSGVTFESPLSYWDVTRHARPVTAFEWLLVGVATAWLAPVASPLALAVLALVHAYYAASFTRLFVAPEPAT